MKFLAFVILWGIRLVAFFGIYKLIGLLISLINEEFITAVCAGLGVIVCSFVAIIIVASVVNTYNWAKGVLNK